MLRSSLGLVVPLWFFAGGCAPSAQYRDHTYRKGSVAFRVGDLPSDWQRISVDSGSIAFHHARGGTIFAGSACGSDGDVSLDVLTNHLLMGIDARNELSRQPLTLDGRAALRSRIDGTVDGVPMALDLVVIKKDGCTYDLHLVASPASYPARRADFDRFLAGFSRVLPSSPAPSPDTAPASAPAH